ncbi:MAG: histidine--tRNA ligase [Anaerolineales bacterium]|nr:histidine--tRNA ligase [Anaerolineales bacterium]
MKKPVPVKGTRDYYPAEMAFRNWLYEQARSVSRKFGYQEFEAPYLETLDLYAAKSGEELVKEQAFVFQDRGGEEVTLRPELTPSLARMVSARQGQLAFPVRWWSFGPFWRYERPQKGRTREFFQWNLDLIGLANPQADAEIAAVICEFFRLAGLSPQEVVLRVNNRRLMESALSELGVGQEARAGAFRLIDKKEKMEAAAWEAHARETGLSAEQVRGLEGVLADRDLWKKSSELTFFFEAAESFGAAEYLVFDPAVVRGLDYYTGTVFEGRDAAGEFRAILGGGRYDNLVADVGGDPLPGVGFAMGDLIIGLILKKLGKEPALRAAPADVLVTTFSSGEMAESIRITQELRKAGICAEWYPAPDRLPKQLKYADMLGIPLAVIAGPEEVGAGRATLKDLTKREQVTVSAAELEQEIRRRLAGTGSG